VQAVGRTGGGRGGGGKGRKTKDDVSDNLVTIEISQILKPDPRSFLFRPQIF
jgi:hypothetical protein